MRAVSKIVIHCADTPNGQKFTLADIDSWHVQRGFKRADAWRAKHRPEVRACGYHFVLMTDGTVELGRHTDEVGAHVAGHNSGTIGICLIGRDEFSPRQWESLSILIQALWSMYPNATVCGHRDFPGVKKTCPNFDAGIFAEKMLRT